MVRKIITLSLLLNFLVIFDSAWGEEQPIIKEKSESKALHWSLGATLIPVAVALVGDTIVTVVDHNQNTSENPPAFSVACLIFVGWPGIIVGPSTGHWYAGNSRRGNKTLILRSLLTFFSLNALVAGGIIGFGGNDLPANMLFGTSAVLAGGVLASAVYDIVTAPKSARIYNEKFKQQAFFAQPIALKDKYFLLAGYAF